MAKMFYTMDETIAALGRDEEGVRQLAREGKLREFRDGPRLMFKADQVEQLKAELGGPDLNVSPTDSGAPIGLADSGSAAGIPLVDSGAPVVGKEDTAFADIGLSGSLGGSGSIPSPGASSHGTRGGITIFDVDDSQKVDPSAQTAIQPGAGDNLSLEGVGSGSGLLDLTREGDDTSLGAVFEELTPAPGAGRPAAPAGQDDLAMATFDRGRAGGVTNFVVAPDPVGVALASVGLVAAAVLLFGGFILAATIMGYRPEILRSLDGGVLNFIFGALGLMIVIGIIGFFVGKAGTR